MPPKRPRDNASGSKHSKNVNLSREQYILNCNRAKKSKNINDLHPIFAPSQLTLDELNQHQALHQIIGSTLPRGVLLNQYHSTSARPTTIHPLLHTMCPLTHVPQNATTSYDTHPFRTIYNETNDPSSSSRISTAQNTSLAQNIDNDSNTTSLNTTQNQHHNMIASSLYVPPLNCTSSLSYSLEPDSFKYFTARHRLFSRFDALCLLDNQGWYSVTPEQLAIHVARSTLERLDLPWTHTPSSLFSSLNENTGKDVLDKNQTQVEIDVAADVATSSTQIPQINISPSSCIFQPSCGSIPKPIIILDAFCGCGGNSIQFALSKQLQHHNETSTVLQRTVHVIAIDTSLDRLRSAQHNAKVYGVESQITFLYGDFFQLVPHLKLCNIDVVYLSPPWGGVDIYKKDSSGHELTMSLQDMTVDGILTYQAARQLTENIIYFLPHNIDIAQTVALASLQSANTDAATDAATATTTDAATSVAAPTSAAAPSIVSFLQSVQIAHVYDDDNNNNNTHTHVSEQNEMSNQQHHQQHLSWVCQYQYKQQQLPSFLPHGVSWRVPRGILQKTPTTTVLSSRHWTKIDHELGLPWITLMFVTIHMLTIHLFPGCLSRQVYEQTGRLEKIIDMTMANDNDNDNNQTNSQETQEPTPQQQQQQQQLSYNTFNIPSLLQIDSSLLLRQCQRDISNYTQIQHDDNHHHHDQQQQSSLSSNEMQVNLRLKKLLTIVHSPIPHLIHDINNSNTNNTNNNNNNTFSLFDFLCIICLRGLSRAQLRSHVNVILKKVTMIIDQAIIMSSKSVSVDDSSLCTSTPQSNCSTTQISSDVAATAATTTTATCLSDQSSSPNNTTNQQQTQPQTQQQTRQQTCTMMTSEHTLRSILSNYNHDHNNNNNNMTSISQENLITLFASCACPPWGNINFNTTLECPSFAQLQHMLDLHTFYLLFHYLRYFEPMHSMFCNISTTTGLNQQTISPYITATTATATTATTATAPTTTATMTATTVAHANCSSDVSPFQEDTTPQDAFISSSDDSSSPITSSSATATATTVTASPPSFLATSKHISFVAPNDQVCLVPSQQTLSTTILDLFFSSQTSQCQSTTTTDITQIPMKTIPTKKRNAVGSFFRQTTLALLTLITWPYLTFGQEYIPKNRRSVVVPDEASSPAGTGSTTAAAAATAPMTTPIPCNVHDHITYQDLLSSSSTSTSSPILVDAEFAYLAQYCKGIHFYFGSLVKKPM